MNKIDNAISEFKEMDEMANRSSPVHELSPLVKLLSTVAYIFFVVSFNKYNLNGLIVMVLYPVVIYQVSGTSIRACFYKLRFILPLVCAVGLFNPFFDKKIMLYIGSIAVSGGTISMLTLMLKGILCIMQSFVLIATTSFDSICLALRRIHIPAFIVTLLLLTYRYISVMMEEVAVMTDAYMLRAPGQKGIHVSAWGSFLGQLLLRSMDKAEEIYSGMQLRGFSGDFLYAGCRPLRFNDILFLVGSIAAFALFRFVDITSFIGRLVM
ncbi:MAG: cobalt ECF transporter T component CbiQ [Oscillospiraceae bacterium]|nr:cobalt ECF transporter T component CbiQ [Oscillospiraceae bacterium]